MKILDLIALPIMNVRMRIDRKSDRHVYEDGHFAVELPEEVASQVEVGDWIEVLCVACDRGLSARLVLSVERWVQGQGLGTKLYSENEFWDRLLNPPYVSKFASGR